METIECNQLPITGWLLKAMHMYGKSTGSGMPCGLAESPFNIANIMRRQEKDHYKLLLDANRNNHKKMWSVIRSVINYCKPSKLNQSFSYNISKITDKKIVSNKFNDYFVNVGKTLAAQIPKSGPSFYTYLPEANRESIFLTPTDYQEIHVIIINIRNSAPGHDGMSSKVINTVI